MTQVNLTASQKAGAAFHGAFSTSINGGVKDRNRGEVPDSENQHGGLTVSNESTVPTLLVEMFFINNTNDATWYKNDGVNKMADAFLAGIGAIKKSQIGN